MGVSYLGFENWPSVNSYEKMVRLKSMTLNFCHAFIYNTNGNFLLFDKVHSKQIIFYYIVQVYNYNITSLTVNC